LNGSNSLGVASIQSFGGFLEGGFGGFNFSFSEGEFFSTFFLLGGEQIVVLDLFVGDFSNEIVQHSGDGVHGAVVFQLSFDLGQKSHDRSFGGVVDGVFVEEGGGGGAGD